MLNQTVLSKSIKQRRKIHNFLLTKSNIRSFSRSQYSRASSKYDGGNKARR